MSVQGWWEAVRGRDDHERRWLRYAEWLESFRAQRFPSFPGTEIAMLARNVSKGVRNDTPPVHLWHAILPTLVIAQRALRNTFGETTVNSAYRSALYNAALPGEGGATQSQHTRNTALDLAPSSGTSEQWLRAVLDDRTAHGWRGGVGIYRGFIHIDTRGVDAFWDRR
jgi:uncharacterized protein YcbK (DUF882 family)